VKEGFKIAAVVALACLFAGDLGYHVANDLGPAIAPLQPPTTQDGSPSRQHEHRRPGEQERNPAIPPVQPAPPGLAPQTRDQGQGKGGKHDGDGTKGDEPDIPNWIQAGSAIATLLVTAGLLFVGVAQLRTYRKQANIMEEQARIADSQVKLVERLERPLLLAIPPRFGTLGYRDNSGKSTFPGIEVCFRNHGRSPALVNHAAMAIVVGRSPPRRIKSGAYFIARYVSSTGSQNTQYAKALS